MKMWLSRSVLILILCVGVLFAGTSQAAVIQSQYDTSGWSYRIQGGFVAWWDPAGSHDAAEVDGILDIIVEVQREGLNDFGMKNPPNIEDEVYFNVYVYSDGDALDDEGNFSGQGIGTNPSGYPYLVMPALVPRSVYHEAFHIMQYNRGGVFPYSDDDFWYTEASANWYGGLKVPDESTAYHASAIKYLPHLPMWGTARNTGISNWQRHLHGYAMNTFLAYMTIEGGVSEDLIPNSFYSGTNLSPQQYLYNEVGSGNFRNYYADSMTRLAADYDLPFMSDLQVATTEDHFRRYGDAADDFAVVETFYNTGTGGDWVRPSSDYVTHAWAYNVYEINNSRSGSYTFTLDGDFQGSEGTSSYFSGHVVVQDGSSKTYYDLNMSNNRDGNLTVNVSSSDERIYFVVASMPEDFEGLQTYSYRMKIDGGSAIAPAGLLALYKFEGDLTDSTGNFNCTAIGDGATFVNDTLGSGNAARFTAGNGANCGNVTSPAGSLDVSYSLWIKDTVSTPNYPIALSKTYFGTKTNPYGYSLMLRPISETPAKSVIGRMGSTETYGGWGAELRSAAYAHGISWNHIVFTYDHSADVTRFYVNGELNATMSGIQGRGVAGAANTVDDLLLAATGANFVGLMDNVAIFDTVLTAGQVSDIHEHDYSEWTDLNRIVSIRKRNALGYALDGSGSSFDGQNVYLWSYGANNANQQWEEIDRGNGYFSYQKKGTNYSLDGGRGGLRNQNVYLWETKASNHNQHWQKVDMGNGYVQLRKRNAMGFGINGRNGGENNQNVNLYDSSNSSHNLQWLIEYK